MKSIKDPDFRLVETDWTFSYQELLTDKLDFLDGDFDQAVINEIILWKVNRYAKFDTDLIKKLNSIKKTDSNINEDFTREILKGLLATK